MKTRITLLFVLGLSLLAACSSDDNGPVPAPVINHVITHNWSDTISEGAFKDWITLLGDHFVDVQSIHVNDIELVLKDTYIKRDEITFQIPEEIPEEINDLITVETLTGVATISFIVNVPPPVIVPDKVSSWLFDDASDPFKAEVGIALETGWRSQGVSHIPSPNGMTGFTPIDGPEIPSGNGGLTVEKGYFLVAEHGIAPNGGGNKVNEYTLMIDFRVSKLGPWYTFLQTDPANGNNDGEIFINASGAIGNADTGYSVGGAKAGEWQRLVVSFKLGEGGWTKYYLNGERILNSRAFPIDSGRYSLESAIVLSGDNDGDDGDMDIAEVAMWDVALDEDQVMKLEEEMNAR